MSPVVENDNRKARPAGRVLVQDEKVIRFAQDCYPAYGTRVRAFEITELTATTYEERENKHGPVLTSSGRGWNCTGMHHVDPHQMDGEQWIACVDGFQTKTEHAYPAIINP